MTKLERLLRGDKANYKGYIITKIVDLSGYVSVFQENILICYNDTYSVISKNSIENNVHFLKPELPRTIKDGLKKGDIIQNNTSTRTVLEVVGSIIFTSSTHSGYSKGLIMTLRELIENGYTLVVEPIKLQSVKEMTIKEVSELVGETVKIIE